MLVSRAPPSGGSAIAPFPHVVRNLPHTSVSVLGSLHSALCSDLEDGYVFLFTSALSNVGATAHELWSI